MAVIGRPHGVRGLVRVVSYATAPALLAELPLRDDRGETWRLSWRGEGVAALTDRHGRTVADRTSAAKLTNLRLHVARADLPDPGEDEFYFADLVGLAAIDRDGASIGRVASVHDYGAGASLEVATGSGSPLLVPFTREAVPVVDLDAGHVVIDPPAEVGSPSPVEGANLVEARAS